LRKLGSFLSIPMDGLTGRPLEPDKLSDKEKNAIDMIMTALSLILKLFIRL
jgi:hypothetical protein